MDMRLFNIANDWANALSKYKRRDEMQIVADEAMWGFGEVQRGRRPDAVLKDVLRRIEDKLCASPSPPATPTATPAQSASSANGKKTSE